MEKSVTYVVKKVIEINDTLMGVGNDNQKMGVGNDNQEKGNLFYKKSIQFLEKPYYYLTLNVNGEEKKYFSFKNKSNPECSVEQQGEGVGDDAVQNAVQVVSDITPSGVGTPGVGASDVGTSDVGSAAPSAASIQTGKYQSLETEEFYTYIENLNNTICGDDTLLSDAKNSRVLSLAFQAVIDSSNPIPSSKPVISKEDFIKVNASDDEIRAFLSDENNVNKLTLQEKTNFLNNLKNNKGEEFFTSKGIKSISKVFTTTGTVDQTFNDLKDKIINNTGNSTSNNPSSDADTKVKKPSFYSKTTETLGKATKNIGEATKNIGDKATKKLGEATKNIGDKATKLRSSVGNLFSKRKKGGSSQNRTFKKHSQEKRKRSLHSNRTSRNYE